MALLGRPLEVDCSLANKQLGLICIKIRSKSRSQLQISVFLKVCGIVVALVLAP